MTPRYLHHQRHRACRRLVRSPACTSRSPQPRPTKETFGANHRRMARGSRSTSAAKSACVSTASVSSRCPLSQAVGADSLRLNALSPVLTRNPQKRTRVSRRKRPCSHLPHGCAGTAHNRPDAAQLSCHGLSWLRPGKGSVMNQQKLARSRPQASTLLRYRRHRQVPARPSTRATRPRQRNGEPVGSASRSATSFTTSRTQCASASANSSGPGPPRPRPHGTHRARARLTTQETDSITLNADQHPPRRGRDQGEFFGTSSSRFMDQNPLAGLTLSAPVGPGPRRPVPRPRA